MYSRVCTSVNGNSRLRKAMRCFSCRRLREFSFSSSSGWPTGAGIGYAVKKHMRAPQARDPDAALRIQAATPLDSVHQKFAECHGDRLKQVQRQIRAELAHKALDALCRITRARDRELQPLPGGR